MPNVLAKSAAIILVVTLAGRLLGLVRDSFVASTYGLSMEADVYNWIVGIILTFYMVIPASINAVYIPVVSKYFSRHDEARRNELFQRVFTVILIVFILLTVLLYTFTQEILSFLQPGYDEATMALGIELFRLAIPAMFVMGIIGLLMSVNYSHKEFFVPSVGTVIFSVSVIITILVIVPLYGIQGLMVGTVAGYLIFAVLLIYDTKRKHYSFGLRLEWRQDHDLRRMGELFVPILIGSAISQSYFYVNQALASMLEDGAQSAIIFANKLFLLPSAIFVGAFTVPLLPILSELVKKKEMEETKRILQKGTAYMHLLMLPTTVAFIVIGDVFIRVVFERGQFTATDTASTYWALLFFSLALYPLAARDLLTRTYYALEDTKTPVIIGLLSVVINFGVAVGLMDKMGHGAMALGFSIATLFNMILLLYLLQRRLGRIYSNAYVVSFGKSLVGSIIMGAVLLAIKHWAGNAASVYVMSVLYIAIGAAVYYIILVMLKEERVDELKIMVRSKLKR